MIAALERVLGTTLTLCGVVGGIIGAALAENASLAGAGAFTFLALTGFGLMWRSHQRDMVLVRVDLDEARRDRQEAREERATCEMRFDIVVAVLREHGIDVPRDAWAREVR